MTTLYSSSPFLHHRQAPKPSHRLHYTYQVRGPPPPPQDDETQSQGTATTTTTTSSIQRASVGVQVDILAVNLSSVSPMEVDNISETALAETQLQPPLAVHHAPARPSPPELTTASLKDALTSAASLLPSKEITFCGARLHCQLQTAAIRCLVTPDQTIQVQCSQPDCPGGLCCHFIALIMSLLDGNISATKLTIMTEEQACFLSGCAPNVSVPGGATGGSSRDIVKKIAGFLR